MPLTAVVQDEKELWVHIEITPDCGPVKYEFDPSIGLVVDRFMRMPMYYPLPYGYAPKTLCDDGDALDILVMVPFPIMPTCWLRVRPVAVLVMEDEKGMDEKILAVPTAAVSHHYDSIHDLAAIPPYLLDSISAFFSHYKTLDHNKWSKVHGWKGADEAVAITARSMAKFHSMLV